jgi:formate dehydrogenase
MFGLAGANTFLRRLGSERLAPLVARVVGVPLSATLKKRPIKLAPDRPGRFWRNVPTPNGRVQLAPREIMDDVPRQIARLRNEGAAPPPLRLIGRRQRRSHNSWMHNLPKLRPQGDECWLSVHPLDAGARGLSDGARVILSSAQNKLEVPLKLDEDVMPGTVSLPHGWGHGGGAGWRIAATDGETGSNVNLLAADGPDALEPLSGMARFNGIEVEITAAS